MTVLSKSILSPLGEDIPRGNKWSKRDTKIHFWKRWCGTSRNLGSGMSRTWRLGKMYEGRNIVKYFFAIIREFLEKKGTKLSSLNSQFSSIFSLVTFNLYFCFTQSGIPKYIYHPFYNSTQYVVCYPDIYTDVEMSKVVLEHK